MYVLLADCPEMIVEIQTHGFGNLFTDGFGILV